MILTLKVAPGSVGAGICMYNLLNLLNKFVHYFLVLERQKAPFLKTSNNLEYLSTP